MCVLWVQNTYKTKKTAVNLTKINGITPKLSTYSINGLTSVANPAGTRVAVTQISIKLSKNNKNRHRITFLSLIRF